MKQTTKSKLSTLSKPASTEAVTFTDGMLVTAEDLGAAMRYPLSVVQVLLKSYFGCGIVCGLELGAKAGKQGKDGADEKPATHGECPPEHGFFIRISKGVALGCDGYPIELCEAAKLDLSPDPCACPIEDDIVKYIAIRRITASDAPPRDCGCDCAPVAGGAAQQCSRLRDHVLIQAFDSKEDLPKGICRRKDSSQAERGGAETRPSLCECLKRCPDCDCCAEPWVLLGTVKINEDGIVEGSINAEQDMPGGGRQYVKPTACACEGPAPASAPAPGGPSDEAARDWESRYQELLARVASLEKQPGAAPGLPAPPRAGREANVLEAAAADLKPEIEAREARDEAVAEPVAEPARAARRRTAVPVAGEAVAETKPADKPT